MKKLRRWSDPVDEKAAERHFARFVRRVSHARRAGKGEDPTTVVTSPNRPARREDEETATIRQHVGPAEAEPPERRRLLGRGPVEGAMPEAERRSFLVELAALYRHGHFEDVALEVDRARRRYPTDVELHGGLTDFFLDRGHLERAIELLFSMVDAHFESADVAAAKRCLERVAALDPDNRRLKRFEKLLWS